MAPGGQAGVRKNSRNEGEPEHKELLHFTGGGRIPAEKPATNTDRQFGERSFPTVAKTKDPKLVA